MSIQVTNLTKKYGTQVAVNNISFSVGKGEIVGFLGPNGAGKSTTMKMLTGYIDADGGSAAVCNIPAGTAALEAKKKTGYLPEANPLYFDMYVKEYLTFIAGVHGVSNARERINEVIQLVGLQREAHKKAGQLSKGYKQRIGLAAALLHNPEVLILDEPTSGLDPNQVVEIRELIKTLGKDKTVLFSSHILQEVEAVCNRVIIINKGNIVADDQLTNLQKSSKGQQAVTVQFKEQISATALQGVQQVSKIEPLPGNEFKLYTTNADAVRQALLALSVQQGWNIVSLQTASNSLEEVFRELTTG